MTREERIELYVLGGKNFNNRLEECDKVLKPLKHKDKPTSWLKHREQIILAIDDRLKKVKDDSELIEALKSNINEDYLKEINNI